MEIVASTELSILGAKAVALSLVSIGGSYCIWNWNIFHSVVPEWKNIFWIGLSLGFIIAGIYICFFKYVQFLGPLIIALLLIGWFLKKMPLWNWKHLLGLISTIICSAFFFFFFVLTISFHLAIEGKI